MSVEKHFPQWFLLLTSLSVVAELCLGYDFDQKYTGVFFNPYIKYPKTADHFDPSAIVYTTTEIEAMLELIAEKFSNVVTFGAGAKNVSYVQDSTYYSSDDETFISRVAAIINRKSGKKKLAMLQGIWYHDHNPRMETELQLAIECAEKANRLFPGTVEGFLFASYIKTNFKEAEQTLNLIRKLKNSSVSHLQIGTRMHNDLLESYIQNQLSQYESDIVTAILRESNFVICHTFASDKFRRLGVEPALESFGRSLLEIRKQLRKSYTEDELEIIGQFYWISKGDNEWNTVKNLQAYWELADQWARHNNFPIRYFLAFDRPDGADVWANAGWWKLTHNSKSDQRAVYIEKISELSEILTTTPNIINNTASESTSFSETSMTTVAILGIVLGTIGLFSILFVFIFILYIRVSTLQQKLSKQNIKEFKKGLAEKNVTQQDACNMDKSALAIPYKNSFEIPKDQLKIHYDKILGTGEFGCVFKAQIDSLPDSCKDVALKMAKDGCSRSALKGILSEIKLLIYIGQHPNIVALMGAYTAELEKGVVYIATELCGLGSLQGYLRNDQKLPHATATNLTMAAKSHPSNSTSVSDIREGISFYQMVQWSLEIASGMEYLGAKNVVHADLATRNVLLSSEKTAKISDFGLSRRMYNYINYVKTQQEPLPWRWMAIESLKMSTFSTKSDVWSYGVTLWEIFSLGDQPYPGLLWSTGFVNMLMDGLRLERPNYADPKLYRLMLDCWNMDVDIRPNFTYIRRLIENYNELANKTSSALAQSEDDDRYEEAISF